VPCCAWAVCTIVRYSEFRNIWATFLLSGSFRLHFVLFHLLYKIWPGLYHSPIVLVAFILKKYLSHAHLSGWWSSAGTRGAMPNISWPELCVSIIGCGAIPHQWDYVLLCRPHILIDDLFLKYWLSMRKFSVLGQDPSRSVLWGCHCLDTMDHPHFSVQKFMVITSGTFCLPRNQQIVVSC